MNPLRSAGRLHGRVVSLAVRSPDPATLARWALGAMLVAAGAHKLLDPGAWAVYVTDWLAAWLVVSPVTFMVVNGYLELLFGALLLDDRATAFASLVAAVSLTATLGYLAVVWVTTGQFGDIVARDVGLAGLAWAVFVAAMRPERSTASRE
ncbi:DoxX family protein [Halobacterium sp. DL1]|nr:DoxX family protein [Halobacterium sp. DL1]